MKNAEQLIGIIFHNCEVYKKNEVSNAIFYQILYVK